MFLAQKWCSTSAGEVAAKVIYEKDGSGGTITETIRLKKGYYRVAMTGGGGNSGGREAWSESCCTRHYVGYSAGGSAAFYGIIYVDTDLDITVTVGAIRGNTSFADLVCGAGGSDAGDPSAAYGGSINGQSVVVTVVQAVISQAGNSGNSVYDGYGYLLGGAGALKFNGVDQNFPPLDTEYGRGTAVNTGSASSPYYIYVSNAEPYAMPGYLRIERIPKPKATT